MRPKREVARASHEPEQPGHPRGHAPARGVVAPFRSRLGLGSQVFREAARHGQEVAHKNPVLLSGVAFNPFCVEATSSRIWPSGLLEACAHLLLIGIPLAFRHDPAVVKDDHNCGCMQWGCAMIEFWLAGERAQAGVFARGSPPDAGYLRTATPGMGAAGSRPRFRRVFVQRPYRPANATETPRESNLHAEDRDGRRLPETEDRRYRVSVVRTEVPARWASAGGAGSR